MNLLVIFLKFLFIKMKKKKIQMLNYMDYHVGAALDREMSDLPDEQRRVH